MIGFVQLLLSLAFVGVLIYLILQIPMPQPFKNIVLGLGILMAILVVLRAFGLIASTPVPILR